MPIREFSRFSGTFRETATDQEDQEDQEGTKRDLRREQEGANLPLWSERRRKRQPAGPYGLLLSLSQRKAFRRERGHVLILTFTGRLNHRGNPFFRSGRQAKSSQVKQRAKNQGKDNMIYSLVFWVE